MAASSHLPTIFVSHSSADTAWCRQFVASLQAAGYDIWYDELGLTGGEHWVATIQRELQVRSILLLISSPAAAESAWVQTELHLAQATERLVIAVLHELVADLAYIPTQLRAIDVQGQEGDPAARCVLTQLPQLLDQALLLPPNIEQRTIAQQVYATFPIIGPRAILRGPYQPYLVRFHATQALLAHWVWLMFWLTIPALATWYLTSSIVTSSIVTTLVVACVLGYLILFLGLVPWIQRKAFQGLVRSIPLLGQLAHRLAERSAASPLRG